MADGDNRLPETLMLQAFEGLKNTVSKHRLAPSDLERAINIDLDDVGQLRRRRGYTLKLAGDFHSVANVGSLILGVKDGELGIINPDYSFDGLGDTVGSERMSYVSVDDTIYWSNRLASGKLSVTARTTSAWGYPVSATEWHSQVITPTEYLTPIAGKLLSPPPTAQHLAYLNGRIYLASGQIIWATELYLYDYVDRTKNFIQYENEITGMGSLPGSLYVGTDEGVWYMSGPFGQMARKKVVTSPMLAGSMVRARASMINDRLRQTTDEADVLLFLTDAGLVAGFDDGRCYNLTQDRFEFPTGEKVFPMLREQDGISQYVAVVDHGGGASNNARIGDYVDAEIVRA